ncbi:hypothetical protein MCW82_16485 [Azospirillum doebereinerae]|nr:hypothetical protein [Azospirillum doebereinerae]
MPAFSNRDPHRPLDQHVQSVAGIARPEDHLSRDEQTQFCGIDQSPEG